MKNKSELYKFIDKLEALTEEHKALWGKMSPQHMVEHLILAVKMGNGKLKLKCFNPPEKLPALKRFLMSERSLPKEFMNPAIGLDLLPLEYAHLNDAKEKLRSELNDHINYFLEHPDARTEHVTFGELNKEEWDKFHKKHFTHHLTQFGLI